METESLFWKLVAGELPPPSIAATQGVRFAAIDADLEAFEVEFQAKREFTNPAGNIQGGFLAATLDDPTGPALAATLAKGEFAPTLNVNASFEKAAKVGVHQHDEPSHRADSEGHERRPADRGTGRATAAFRLPSPADVSRGVHRHRICP